MAFRPYTTEEVRAAAEAYGVDPDFAEAIYAAESSRGTNPKAMTARTVKQKRGSTIVRGPFQLEDATAADLIRENKLGNVDVNDPDVHLDLAMRQMKKLQDMYQGDFGKMAQAYLGGPGSVGTNARDELGTSVGGYSNSVMNEMAALRGGPMGPPSSLASIPETPDMGVSPFMHGASADEYGIPSTMQAANPDFGPTWSQLIQAGGGVANQFALPASLGGNNPMQTSNADDEAYIRQLVDEELKGKDFANAA